METTKLEPPDGGYGWVIVFASVLNNVSEGSVLSSNKHCKLAQFLMVPLIQNVVLIFKDKMMEIDMTITEMWFALNVHASFGYLTHLLNNLLLNRFGYRKVALTGVTFVFFGLSMSSWIHNYLGFMLTFGVVAGTICEVVLPVPANQINRQVLVWASTRPPTLWPSGPTLCATRTRQSDCP